ncbi:hypothetical protein GW930_02270 [Candidatus Saccharibacteria bacterium]|nr:hypothetical protein [Candidatus Saccharibacteria bacterium]
MVAAGVLGAIAMALFLGAYWSKRRFGLLGLALTAGATVSTIWSYNAGLVIASTGLIPDATIANAVTLSIIVLLPAAVLLFHGYRYKTAIGRAIGSFLFTVLALAFLIEPISYALPFDGVGADIYALFMEYREAIISVGVVVAVADLFFTKPVALRDRKK